MIDKIKFIILMVGVVTAFSGCTYKGEKEQMIRESKIEDVKNEETIDLYGFPIPINIINADENNLIETSLPIINWYEDWEYMGIRIEDGVDGLEDKSYKLESLLKLKYDNDEALEIMKEFKRSDTMIEFNDNTYIKFGRSSDGARMVYIGEIEKNAE